ncbi:MAG TPA: hypothetical protein VGQ83_13675 [Polyangia bacterium]
MSEFFHELITTALRNQAVATSEMTEFYLVNLLTEFMRGQIADEPLALKMAQAATEAPQERARHLKEVGDTSLYMSGFFAESLERRAVALSYYITLGGSAYAALSGLIAMSRAGEAYAGVYGELAEKFPRFVDVLSEVSEKSAFTSNQGTLKLYERWVQTRSSRIAQQLMARGLIPPRGGGAAH